MAWIRGVPMLALVAAAAVVIAAAARAEARGPDHHRPSTFTVTGKVQCQDCTKNWNAYAYNARPIHRSMVGITCVDDRGKVVYYDSDQTDEQGVFNIEVHSKLKNGCDVAASRCVVRLASSGDGGCAVPTDFNGGMSGVRPSSLRHNSPDRVTYAVGPFYYTLPRCDVKDDDEACKTGSSY